MSQKFDVSSPHRFLVRSLYVLPPLLLNIAIHRTEANSIVTNGRGNAALIYADVRLLDECHMYSKGLRVCLI
jgi:hypothetical protein